MPLPEWLPRLRDNRAHSPAWAAELTSTPGGFTPFASSTEVAVLDLLAQLGVDIDSRTVHTTTGTSEYRERWVEIQLHPLPIAVWIYADQIDVVGSGVELRLEHFDSTTPNVARETALAALTRAVATARSGTN